MPLPFSLLVLIPRGGHYYQFLNKFLATPSSAVAMGGAISLLRVQVLAASAAHATAAAMPDP